jgi:hypothetical protein
MLSNTTISVLVHIFVYATKLRLTPYEWNSRSMKLGWSVSKKSQISCILVTLYYTGDCVYLSLMWLGVFFSSVVPFEDKMNFSMHWFTRLGALILLYSILIKNKDYSHLYNTFIGLDQKLQRKTMIPVVLASVNDKPLPTYITFPISYIRWCNHC